MADSAHKHNSARKSSFISQSNKSFKSPTFTKHDDILVNKIMKES